MAVKNNPNSKFTTVQSGGKNYPTTKEAVASGWTPEQKNSATWMNPDTNQVEPMTQSSVNFPKTPKAGGGDKIQVSAGGKTFDLSREEYIGGLVTPQTMALDQAIANQKAQISSDVKMVNDANAGTMPSTSTTTTANPTPQDTANVQEQSIPTVNESVSMAEKKTNADGYVPQQQKRIQTIMDKNAPMADRRQAQSEYTGAAVKEGVGNTLKLAVTLYDIYRQVTGRKSTSVTQAEDSFNNAKSALTEEISRVKSDPTRFSDAMTNYNLMVQALANTRSIAKGKGQASLSYWRDNGLQMETLITQETTILDGMRDDLIKAKLQGDSIAIGQQQGAANLDAAKKRLGR